MFCRKRKENAVTAGVMRYVGKGNCCTVAQCEHALWCTCRPSQQGSAGCCFSKQPPYQLHARCRTSRAICCLTWPNLWHVEICAGHWYWRVGWYQGEVICCIHDTWGWYQVTFLSVPKRLILLSVGETFRDFFILYLKRYRRLWIDSESGFRVLEFKAEKCHKIVAILIFGTSNGQLWKKVWDAKCSVNAKPAE